MALTNSLAYSGTGLIMAAKSFKYRALVSIHKTFCNRHNYSQHNELNCDTRHKNAECCYTECRVLLIVMLNVIMLSIVVLNVIMLNVVMLSVVMLSVVSPNTTLVKCFNLV